MLVQIGNSFFNPENVIAILPNGQNGCTIILPDSGRVTHDQSSEETAKLLFPPPAPFDPDDIPF